MHMDKNIMIWGLLLLDANGGIEDRAAGLHRAWWSTSARWLPPHQDEWQPVNRTARRADTTQKTQNTQTLLVMCTTHLPRP